MKQRFSEEQIVRMLRQTEAGNQTVAEVCKEHGVSEQTWYRWKKKFGQMEVPDVRRLRELEKENGRLKFDRLEVHPGVRIYAGQYLAKSGETRRVAVCIGPEHRTVGPELVEEAVQGIGFGSMARRCYSPRSGPSRRPNADVRKRTRQGSGECHQWLQRRKTIQLGFAE